MLHAGQPSNSACTPSEDKTFSTSKRLDQMRDPSSLYSMGTDGGKQLESEADYSLKLVQGYE